MIRKALVYVGWSRRLILLKDLKKGLQVVCVGSMLRSQEDCVT